MKLYAMRAESGTLICERQTLEEFIAAVVASVLEEENHLEYLKRWKPVVYERVYDE